MNFASDNVMGASAPVLEALLRANEGALAAYGADEITKRVERRFAEISSARSPCFSSPPALPLTRSRSRP